MRITANTSRALAVGAIGAISVATAGIGVATAANGGSLTLGHSNTATKTTTLKDTTGTPLSLIGKKSKPPIKINSSQLVKHLNAALLNGATSSELSTGSGGHFDMDLIHDLSSTGAVDVIALPLATGTSPDTHFSPVLVVRTGPLKAGTYAVTANAVSTMDVLCFVGTDGSFPGTHQYGVQGAFSTSGEFIQNAENDYLTVKQGQEIGEYCVNADNEVADGPAYVLSDALGATRVNSPIQGVQTQPTVVSAVRVKHAGK